MSYSIAEAIIERHDCINRAIEADDASALYRYAELYAKEGEDEAAEHLLNLAKRARLNENSYDEQRDNNL